jgi:choline dehydrogenase-like flavoprotein
MDAASFTSGACQNPTLTIMALALRSSEALLERMRSGEV